MPDEAVDPLFAQLYDELKRRASAMLKDEKACHTLQTTALVNEAWLRLNGVGPAAGTSRSHFLQTAALAMRHVLVDHARAKGRLKRGKGREREPLDAETPAPEGGLDLDDVLELDRALKTLEGTWARLARIVQLHYFCGLTHEEIAAVLEVALSTVKRDHRAAKALISEILRNPQHYPR
jgi:RNA polymerase sigma-70 factor (ECF subfamily)